MKNVSNLLSVQFWSLWSSSRIFYDFQKMLISWHQFIFSCWWLTILIATVHTFKKNEKGLRLIIIGCWAIRTGWDVKKGLNLGPSLQNQNKKELEMFVVSDTNISLSFILILNRIQEKYQNMYFLICSNVDDNVINAEVCRFIDNTKT